MKTTDCTTCRSYMPDLLLDENFVAARPSLAAHLAACAECRGELVELRSTLALLDEFHAPEPSTYFDSKLHARLREAIAAEPEGFFERVRSFLLFSTGRQLRPALAMSLAFMLLIGGGTFAGIRQQHANDGAPTTSATVNDLKILDNNAQALQQMDQLLDEGSSSDDGGDSPTT